MSHATTTRAAGTDRDHTAGDGARAGAVAGLIGAIANVAIYSFGTIADAAWEVESGGEVMAVPLAAVIVLSAVVPVVAGIVLAFLTGRWAGARRAWPPFVLVIGALSLGGVLGAEDTTTAVALGLMHLVVASVAAFVLPRRLDR